MGGIQEQDLEQRVKGIIAAELGIDPSDLKAEQVFGEDLAMDSLDKIQIVMLFEEAFGVGIRDDDEPKIQSVGQAVEFVRQRLEAGLDGTAGRR